MTSMIAPPIATSGTTSSIQVRSAPEVNATAQKTPTAPSPASTMPAMGVRTSAGGDTLWPRMTATMSSRPSPREGIIAAMTADATAHPTMIATGRTGTSNGPNIVSGR